MRAVPGATKPSLSLALRPVSPDELAWHQTERGEWSTDKTAAP